MPIGSINKVPPRNAQAKSTHNRINFPEYAEFQPFGDIAAKVVKRSVMACYQNGTIDAHEAQDLIASYGLVHS